MVEQQNNSNELIFSVENSSNRELGKQIRQELDSLASNFMELDDQENKILIHKKSIILEMADKFERLQEIGEYPFPVHKICNGVYRFLQRKGYNISKNYVYDVIRESSPQYIGDSYDSVSTLPIDIKIQQEDIMKALQTLKNTNKKILRREQIQDIIPGLYETIDDFESYADANNITPVPAGQTTEPHYDAEELDPFRDAVITDKPEPRISNLSEATHYLADSMRYCANIVEANAEMMEKYPPDVNDAELEIKAVQRVKDWASWFRDVLATAFKSGTDRKYRRSIIEWVKIAEDEHDWGKHAASSKNPYLARFIDKKTGEWKEEIRKLTREQIGDKSPKVREFTKRFYTLIPAGVDIIRWSEKNLNPFTNGESVKLSSKLSDRSLR